MQSLKKQRAEADAALDSVLPGLNNFSKKIYEYLGLENDDNVVVSPLGVAILLAMTADGARGQSAVELETNLHLPKSTTCNKGYLALINYINSLNIRECEIRLANKIVTSNLLKIKKKFGDDMAKFFLSPITEADFSKRDEVCEMVNKWCKEQTNGRISKALEPGNIPAIPSLFLFNAIYLKCPWANRFDKYSTESHIFHISSDATVEVPMMQKTDDYKYGEISELDARFIRIPLKDVSMSMMVFLPNKIGVIQVKELEKYLCTVDFCKLLETSNRRLVALTLPKFRIESSVDAMEALKKMGLKEVLDESKADFTRISDTLPLFIDGVMQQTFLDVNEFGVEAAAVTRLLLKGGGYGPSTPPISFNVNRPFMCVIVAENYGVPIFMARVVNPKL